MMEVYYQEDYLTIFLDEDNSLAKAVWQGFLSSQELRHRSQVCLELIENLGLRNWLADNRKMKAIRKQDQEWLLQEMAPKLGRSSLRRMATLVSEDIFNQMAVESMYQKANGLFRFDHQYFKDEISALLWLKQSQYHANYS
jgi:hypothetical protein